MYLNEKLRTFTSSISFKWLWSSRKYVLTITRRFVEHRVEVDESPSRKRYCSLRYFWSIHGCAPRVPLASGLRRSCTGESVIYRLHRTHERACKTARDTFDTTGWPWRRRHWLVASFFNYRELSVSHSWKKQTLTY